MSIGWSSSSQCSFLDITNFTGFYGLSRKKNLLEFKKMYPGYLVEIG